MLGLERLNPWRAPRQVPESRAQVAPPSTSESSASEHGEQQGALERARARASLARDFVSRIEPRPETLYGQRREDAMEDLLLGEVALDLLSRQSTSNTVVRDVYSVGHTGQMMWEDEYTLPASVQIAGQTLEVGEILGVGGFGIVVECGDDYVVKFIRALGDNTDNTFLSFAAREISALARFHPLPEADPVFLQGMEAAQLRPRQTRTTDRIPGFLGATRVEFPVEEKGQTRREEYIAVAMERVKGENLHEALEGEATFEFVTPQTYPELMRQLAQALAVFHEAGILHRDVKSPNVMVSFPSPGHVDAKLTDMGAAVDADYRVRVQQGAVRQYLFDASALLRDHLLELSFTNQFSPRAEEAWLELAALVDRVEAGEVIESETLDQRARELVEGLSQIATPPKTHQAAETRDRAFHTIGTKGFTDRDTLAGTPTTASDVFALGVTVGTFLVATAARRAGVRINFEQAGARMDTADLLRDAILLRELGGDERARRMAGLIKSMINKDASRRPANAMEVLRELEAIRG